MGTRKFTGYRHISNSSQELGNGLADVIFGRYNPAGRTTQTWVKSIEDLPPMMDYDIRNGRTYMYTKRKPLYPFGYGLSYTTFEYRKVTLSSDSPAKKDTLRIVVDVKNTGDVKGEEVVQLYVSYPDSKVKRPIKQLKGFKRQMINAGQTVPVEINLKVEDLAYWDMNRKEFVVEDGRINLMIGSSSDNILLTKQIRIK